MNPKPKTKPIRLKGDAYHRLRWDAFFRAAGCCEMIENGRRCGRWAPFDSPDQVNGEVSHYPKSRGAGAGDTLDDVLWSCLWCHKKHHGN